MSYYNNEEMIALQNEVERLRRELKVLTEALIESQDWNWLEAKGAAEMLGQDFFDIVSMQELHEIAVKAQEDWLC